jgi:hypothetical protein
MADEANLPMHYALNTLSITEKGRNLPNDLNSHIVHSVSAPKNKLLYLKNTAAENRAKSPKLKTRLKSECGSSAKQGT